MRIHPSFWAFLLMASAGCVSSHPPHRTPLTQAPEAAPELTRQDFLFAVLRYLYRWQLDAATFVRPDHRGVIEVWVRSLKVESDAGDRSRFAELWLPTAGLLVHLKQADHDVPERGLVLKDDGFKIRAVEQPAERPALTPGWTRVRLLAREVYAHLFLTRQERLFPDAAVESRMKSALATYLRKHHEPQWLEGPQTFYASPISPVSAERWVFWENQRMALRIQAEGGLDQPRVWEQLSLHLRMISLEDDITVSPEEAPDGRRLVSRDWAARFLYNCVVLGRKFSLSSAAGAPAAESASRK
jgi:hypothetical protein